MAVKSLAHGGLVRGLHGAAKVIEKHAAQLCILTENWMGKGSTTEKRQDNQDAFLQLSITILAAFCRLPDIASSEDMFKKIPLILEVLSTELGPPLVEECFEFLYLVTAAREDGVQIFYESGGMTVLASQMCEYDSGYEFNILIGVGSHTIELAMKLLQLTVAELSLDKIIKKHCSEKSSVVTTLAKQCSET
ncbi:neurochondrin isoform X2 [Tanacetum coccineum]